MPILAANRESSYRLSALQAPDDAPAQGRSRKMDHQPLSCRNFLAGTAAAAAALPTASLAGSAAPHAQGRRSRPVNPGGMQTRKLAGLEVSAIGAGAMSISGNYGPP